MFNQNQSASNLVANTAEFTVTETVADETGAIGAVGFKRYGNLHVFFTGENAKGKTPIQLDGPEEVFGFLNALTDFVDHPEMFSVLNLHVHKYAQQREFGEASGYVLDVITTPDGLDVNRITSLKRRNNADEYDHVINAVPYSVSNTWKKPANREENRMNHAIVNRHLGLNYVLNVAAGTHSVSFKAFGWSERNVSALADKIRGFGMDVEFRDGVKADKSLARRLFSEAEIITTALESGKLVVPTEVANVSAYWYQNIFLDRVDCTLNNMIGKKFFLVRKGGSRLPFRHSMRRIADAVIVWKQALENDCYLSETE